MLRSARPLINFFLTYSAVSRSGSIFFWAFIVLVCFVAFSPKKKSPPYPRHRYNHQNQEQSRPWPARCGGSATPPRGKLRSWCSSPIVISIYRKSSYICPKKFLHPGLLPEFTRFNNKKSPVFSRLFYYGELHIKYFNLKQQPRSYIPPNCCG